MKKPSLMDRLRLKKTSRKSVVGVGWYNEDNWARVKLAATDAERFEASYPEWLEMALATLADFRKAGINAVQFNIVAEELLPWCLANNKMNDAASRAEFVAEKLRTQGRLIA
jgi:hypothetical protein